MRARAVAYLRRSTDRQGLSLGAQLEWALQAAEQRGLVLRGSAQDLEVALQSKSVRFGDICFDNAVSGSRLDRPGLSELKRAVRETGVSHLFVHKRDRLARPDDPIEGVQLQNELRRPGLTIVFSDAVLPPRDAADGEDRILTEGILSLVGYHDSGKFLRDLAERIISSQHQLAREGFSTGGRAPYGFARYLVQESDGKIIRRLEDGERTRKAGCHVRALPDDREKLTHWLWMLEMKEMGWGFKRIATRLNDLGIPSPDAGRTRTDHGEEHLVSGKWTHTTVRSLVNNPIIVGIREYGRRSEGRHRRTSVVGPRRLTRDDHGFDDQPRRITNPESEVIKAEAGFDAEFNLSRWEAIQRQVDQRATNQKGIRRAKDPGKYPLATRIVDLTEGCGSIMYGAPHSGKTVYKCGRYQKSGGADCYHNTVDAEALLAVVLGFLRRPFADGNLREVIADRLRERLAAPKPNSPCVDEHSLLVQRLAKEKADLARIEERWAKEENDARHAALGRQFDKCAAEVARLEEQLHTAERKVTRSPNRAGTEQMVESCLGVLDRLETLSDQTEVRPKIGKLMQDMQVWVGLNYRGVKRGKRTLQKIKGGMISVGGYDLPVPLHGRENLRARSSASTTSTNENSGTTACCSGAAEDDRSPSDDDQSSGPSGPGRTESFTKGSRGDWI